ncbi:hypothetical protein TA3x_003676 [Tundrisphaera sp. TA3]|uniref:hypothetical protein n=1 Tax=Tundrisphaera sp. TA3 TaxID=3435775 RepID=UPI003EBF52D4
MASQRITIAKLGGLAAEVALRRLRAWAEARRTTDPHEWSGDQWPPQARIEADAFAERLRANAPFPPVLHFVEWADLWSMGDLFGRWLSPPGGPSPLIIHADRVELYGYALPDDGRLLRHLKKAGPQQFDECDQFIGRLREALLAWQDLAEQAVIIVIREVVGGLVTDEDLAESLSIVPSWLDDNPSS